MNRLERAIEPLRS